MDFFQIQEKSTKDKSMVEIYPEFLVGRSKDLMVRAASFYAIWDEEKGLWSTDEYDVQRLVDAKLYDYLEQNNTRLANGFVKDMRSFDSNIWVKFRQFTKSIGDNSHQLDENLTFANTEVKKSDYVSRRLPYSIQEGDYSAWDELVGTLYSPEERQKIEWAIGAIVSGDSKKIQKFLVLYGPAGTGKSTILNVVEKLFTGYTTSFEAKALGRDANSFATEAFRHNPLVAIQHDGDLSKIDDNTKLNSIIAHEDMTMNEKFKPSYTARVNAFLFMGTNQPVKISDAKSGIIRRLIDVSPSGKRLQVNHYHSLISQIEFELGAIAAHCLEVYEELGKNFYNAYRPLEMMLQTDVFFNFIESSFDVFKRSNGTTLKLAYAMYKEYCNDTGIERPLPQYKVREELRNYFDDFEEKAELDGHVARSVYLGFNASKFRSESKKDKIFKITLEDTTSSFDRLYEDAPAQYATENGTPSKAWMNVKTTLSEIDTSQLHFVKVPENHIVLDFDLKDDNGNKSLERNLAAASDFPATYAELSRSGSGVHLHYYYDGPVGELSSVYSEGIEVKVFTGGSALRRRLSRCNSVGMATLNGGLPLKEKKMIPVQTIQSEKGLRELIKRNLRKEVHPGTKPSIDFIHRILEDAHDSGLVYDVSDMRNTIMAFGNNSTNQALTCLKIVNSMKFKSDTEASETNAKDVEPLDTSRLVHFDCEVYPNLFVLCWEYDDSDETVRMINPDSQAIEPLLKMKLVGFNCRRYDNHIVWARYLGYDNKKLYELSQRIIDHNIGAMFGEAYNLSYADIYDFSSKKQSLKKFQIDLGLRHLEMGIPWDQPVPDDRIEEVVEYCVNDVKTSKAVFHDRAADFTARQILAELSGLTVNDTTQKHTAKIIFGGERNPQQSFVYTDLATGKQYPYPTKPNWMSR